MGAAAGKQFQSEKAKHAEAVLNAVHLFEETNDQEEDSYRGGINTDFFKRKVKLAASDAKSKGKDIDKSLAHLTDADLDMLAHYDENRKDEERRQAGNTLSSMQVEEIIDDENVNNDNGGDNIDETTSVLSYGDDEEAAEHDDLDSSDDMIENIEEVVETRPRLNSGFKVFPINDVKEESKTHVKSPEPTKLKLDVPVVRPGVADHFAKFWDYEEPGSATSHVGVDSPVGGAGGGLQSATNTPGKKFQSPKPNFPYKDRGQRIDERNETLMVLQRQKVISLTQNAQLEREVEALQRQLEKMDQIEQTFESHRLGDSNRSSGSLNNTGNSSSTVHGASGLQPPYKHSDYTNHANYGSGSHSNNLHSKYSYIYPIDEEAGLSTDCADQSNIYISPTAYSKHHMHSNAHSSVSNRAESKASGGKGAGGIVVTGSGVSAAHSAHARRTRKGSGAKHSSPSSSDNDSINSYNKNSNATGNSKFRNNANSAESGTGLNNKAQGKILRVKSNDQSDLSDEFTFSTPSQPVLGIVGKASSAVYHNNSHQNQHSTHATSSSGKSNGVLKGVRRTRAAVALTDGADSDDSTSQRHSSGAHAGAARSLHQDSLHNSHQQQYKMSQHSDSEAPPDFTHIPNLNTGAHVNGVTPTSTTNTSTAAQIQQGVGRSTKSQALKIQNKRVISVGVKPSSSLQPANNSNSNANSSKNSTNHAAGPDDTNTKKESDSDTNNTNINTNNTHNANHSAHNSGDKYRALLDNVSVHLESNLKLRDESPTHTTSTASNGNAAALNPSRLPMRNKGGALKKLNKRRHSMDGLHDDTATDNSQDEDSKFNRQKFGVNGRANGADKSPSHAQLAGISGQGLSGHSLLTGSGTNYTTTDDESLGHNNSSPNNRNKIRRPRAKLQVHQTNPANQSPQTLQASQVHQKAEEGARDAPTTSADVHTNAGNAGSGANSTGESHNTDTNSSNDANKAHDVVSHLHLASKQDSDGENASVKPKRRTRAAGVKAKSEAHLNTHSSASSHANSGAAAAPTGPWDSTLDQWWAEISLLLRKPILQEEDMLYTVAAAEAGLMYTEEMNSIAKTLNVLRGALSRWILPYDNNTRIDSQCSTPHSVVENMPEEFRGKLTERQVHYLVAGANGVRKLVRVKIADDNDLEQARKALKSTDMFFKALYHRAKESGMTPYELLQQAEKFSYN